VRILTRGATTDIYPLRIYAFAEDGVLKESKVIHSSADPIRLMLPTGTDMRIVAMVADELTYTIPENPTSSSLLTSKLPQLPKETPVMIKDQAKGYVDSHPLQIGVADICPAASNATVSLQMYYQMTSLNISLSGLPEECTMSYVNISTSADAISMTGELVGSQKVCVPLLYDAINNNWSTGEVFLFPTIGTQTNFTIVYNDSYSEYFAVVSFMSPLIAGTPYKLHGTLSTEGSLAVYGSVSTSQWGDPVDMFFNFSPDKSTVVSPNGDSSSGDLDESLTYPTYIVDTIPSALSLWEGHIVVDVASDEVSPSTSATLLLLSLEDYSNVTSAYNLETPTQATGLAAEYIEYDLGSWSIPTEEEARCLRNAYLNDTAFFANLLLQANASPIFVTDNKGNNTRYLCDEAQKTYSFKYGSSYNSIKAAGAKVDSYHLRLIKTIKVKTQ
jgi:hypothetical protein